MWLLSAIVAIIAAIRVGVGVDCSDSEVYNDPKEDPSNDIEDDPNDDGHLGVGASLLWCLPRLLIPTHTMVLAHLCK